MTVRACPKPPLRPPRMSKPLKRSGWLARGKPPKARKQGSAFPKRRDRAFMAWLFERLEGGVPCDAECGRVAQQRAHLVPRGRGGADLGNVALLCLPCHQAQEKQTERFNAERGVDLYRKAQGHAERYGREVGT